MLYHPRSQRPITATTQIHQGIPTHRTLIPQPSPTLWVTIVGPTTAIATHNLAEPLYPRRSRHHWHLAVYQGPTSRRCVHARRRSTPTPRGDAQATRKARAIVLCVPLGDPHVHKVMPSGETRQECSHGSANPLGPVHHMARAHPTDEKSKSRKRRGA